MSSCSCWESRASPADLPEDQYAVAASHYGAAHWELAADEFGTFLQLYPEHERTDNVIFFLAESLVQLGRLDEAQQRFGEYLACCPDGQYARQALFRVGEAKYLSGKHEQARPIWHDFRSSIPTIHSMPTSTPTWAKLRWS